MWRWSEEIILTKGHDTDAHTEPPVLSLGRHGGSTEREHAIVVEVTVGPIVQTWSIRVDSPGGASNVQPSSFVQPVQARRAPNVDDLSRIRRSPVDFTHEDGEKRRFQSSIVIEILCNIVI